MAARCWRVTAVLALVLGVVGLSPAAPAPGAIQVGVSASALAGAVSAQTGLVTGATFTDLASSNAVAVVDSFRAGMPTAGGAFGLMTTGNADYFDDANTASNTGADLGGGNVRGNTDLDVTILRIDLNVPTGDNCLSFDFRFLSEEYPEYLGSQYNDAFLAELMLAEIDESTWTTSGSEIIAPDNFAYDPSDSPITINGAGYTSMASSQSQGTTYDAATPLLSANTPITPGAHRLFLSIFDQGDHALDSATMLDNLHTSNTPASECTPGAGIRTDYRDGRTGEDGSFPYAGDPVDAASGNFIDTTVDLPPADDRMLDVSRTYNSFDLDGGLLGPGWTMLPDVAADRSRLSQGRLVVTLPDGRNAVFTQSGATWVRPDRFDADLSIVSGNVRLTWDDGGVWNFDANDRLATATTRLGETVTINRATDGRPTTITSAAGVGTQRTLTYTYTTAYPWAGGASLLQRISTNDGRSVDVHFVPRTLDAAETPGLLARVGNPRLTSAAAWSTGWKQYRYDPDDLLERIEMTIDAGANPTATSVRARLKVANTYDAFGRVETQLNPDGSTTTFSYGAGTTTVVDGASGDSTTYASDDDGRSVGITDALQAGLTKSWGTEGQLLTFTDRAGATHRLLYDGQHRLRVRLLPDATTGQAETPTTGQDWTNVASWASRYEAWTYASGGPAGDPRVATYRNAAGEVTTYQYNGLAPRPSQMTTATGTPLAATTTYTYATGAAQSQIASITTPEGVVTSYTYGSDGRRQTETAGGRTTTYTHIDRGGPGWVAAWATAEPTVTYAEQVTTPGSATVAQRTTTVLVGADGRILRTIDPLAAAGTPGHGPSRNLYDDLGEVTGTIDEAGGQTTYVTRLVTDRLIPRDPATACGCGPDPAWTEAATIGRVETETDADGVATIEKFSKNGDLVEERVQQGAFTPKVTRHVYGALGRLIRTEVDAGTVANPVTEVTTFGYDANGNRTQVTTGPTLGATDRTWTTVYDTLGRVTEELGPQGDPFRERTTHTYDLLGRRTSTVEHASTAGTSVMTTWRYDAAGRVSEQVTYPDGYTGPDLYPSLAAHPDAVVTRTSYDDDSRPVTVVEGPPNTQTHAWPASETPAQLDALAYTDARRITRHTYHPTTGEPATVRRPDQTVENMSYDAAGRLHEVTETSAPPTSGSPATRLVARYTYDLLGRVLHENSAYVTAANVVGEVVVDRTWSPTGLLLTETDPHLPGAPAGDISTRTSAYTPAGQLSTSLDALGHKVTYVYERGDRTKRRVWNAAGTAVVSEQTWVYTRDGKIASASLPHTPGAASPPATSYTYDDRSRLTLEVDPSGKREGRTYLNSGVVATATWKTGFSDPTPTSAAFTYDAAGRRTGSTGSLGTYTWGYDRLGQLTLETKPDPMGGAAQTDQWRWGLAGDRIWYRDAAGRRTRFDYDKMHRISQVSLDIAAETSPPSWFAIATYGRSGYGDTTRESLSIFNSGGQRLWTRDLVGRIRTYDQTVTPSGQPATTTASTQTWRPDGRLATETSTGQPSWAYDYDDAGELVTADPSTGTTLAYTYGIAGQRATATDASGTQTYTWDAAKSQLTGITGPTGTRAFTYDGAGRRATEATTPSGGSTTTTTSTYDDRALLASMASPTNTVARTYDIDSRLASLDDTPTDGVPLVSITWDSSQAVPVPTRMAVGSAVYSVDAGEGPVRVETSGGGGARYYAQDVRDSIITTATTPTYDPFGYAPVDLDFGYRGELTITRLVHLRNRDYDPSTGTFTTPDPLDSVDGAPTNGNPYHYADNDPLNRTDPLGLRPGDPDMAYPGWDDDNVPDSLEPGFDDDNYPGDPNDNRRSWIDEARNAIADAWSQRTTSGVCLSSGGAFSTLVDFLRIDVGGCLLDDGDHLGALENVGIGVSFPPDLGTDAITYLVSNASHINNLKGGAVCVGGGGFIPTEYGFYGAVGQVCLGTKAFVPRHLLDLFHPDVLGLTGVATLAAGPGMSEGPFGVSLTATFSYVQEISPLGISWVREHICGGRFIDLEADVC